MWFKASHFDNWAHEAPAFRHHCHVFLTIFNLSNFALWLFPLFSEEGRFVFAFVFPSKQRLKVSSGYPKPKRNCYTYILQQFFEIGLKNREHGDEQCQSCCCECFLWISYPNQHCPTTEMQDSAACRGRCCAAISVQVATYGEVKNGQVLTNLFISYLDIQRE